jgi:hypothetical protein
MFDKKMNRREFLKMVIASAAAAGGALPVLADGCGHPAGIPDTCNEMLVDYCNPGEDTDICPDPNGGASSSDVCVPQLGEPDECDPAVEYDPDLCDPIIPAEDICASPSGPDVACQQAMVPDVCGEGPLVPDTCDKTVGNPDVCPDSGPPPGDGDICILTGPNNNADECIPAVNEPDLCSADTGTDFCRNPDSGIVEPDICSDPDPDICYENGQNVVDVCEPPSGDPDADPNVLQLTTFKARSGIATMGAVAALGAAALLRPRKEDKASV